MTSIILEIILVGAKIFQDERKNHFEKKAQKLMTTIISVEDSEFYKKDQESKGMAERLIYLDAKKLAEEYLKEAKK